MISLLTNKDTVVVKKLNSGFQVLEVLDLGIELRACDKKTREIYTIKSHSDFDNKLKKNKENYEYYTVERGSYMNDNRETTNCTDCTNCGVSHVTDEMNNKQYAIDEESEYIIESLLRSEEGRIEEEYKTNKEWFDNYRNNNGKVNKLATDIIGDMIEDERKEALDNLRDRIQLYARSE